MSAVEEAKAGKAGKASRSEMVKKAALARFFQKQPYEIDRMREEDGLPFVTLPGENKPSYRYFLPSVHAWLVRRAGTTEELKDYGRFKAAFFEAQPGGGGVC